MQNTPLPQPSSVPEPDWLALAKAFADDEASLPASTVETDTARQAWSLLAPAESTELDRRAVWGRITARTHPPAISSVASRRPARVSRKSWRWMGGVAGMAIAAGLVWGVRVAVPGTDGALSTYTTQRGEIREIALADGSFVTLAPESQITISGEGGEGGHRVALTGEAYFTVVHNDRRTFIVTSAGVSTRVLGTAFNMRAYPSDTAVHVVVADGRVAVERNVADHSMSRRSGQRDLSSSVVLQQGEAAVVMPDAETLVMRNAPLSTVIGWKQGIIDVRDIPLRDLIPDLERMYDVDIHVPDSTLANRSLTVMLATRSVTSMLNTIAPIVDAQYSIRNKSVVLMPKASR